MAAHTLAEILAEFLKKRPDTSARLKQSRAVKLWSETVGPLIARHAEALFVKQGVLVVSVDSPVWKNELYFRRHEILKLLNAKLVAVEGPADVQIRELSLVDRGKN